ncbi:MAG: ATP-binding protein, partial [Tannerellaceae bacterium]|nr:ATP-binding protein [Tannerellaceae bacterium]
SASPFNIVTKSLTLNNFTREEVAMLYGQHTGETGQVFEDSAIELAWEQTQGQPWLVNAIAREVIMEILHSDYTQTVTADMVKQAIKTIILRCDTHLDSLLEQLKEERVRNVIEPIILGEYVSPSSDDFHYTRDLGLIRMTKEKTEPANPIYAEAIVRTLNFKMQSELQQHDTLYQMPRYLKGGRIDMDFLMRDFQQFWRENSGIWEERFSYKEAAPHLILMAFLQRVVNGGGQIIREMAAGRGFLDLCLIYDSQKYPIELKLWRNEKTLEKGLEQTARYMDTCGCVEGWLAIFDRCPEVKWDDKIYMRKETVGLKTITVVGL